MVDGLVDLHRLVGQQHAGPRAVPVAEGAGEVRPLALVLAGDVVHAREVEVGQLRAGVLQRVQAEPADLLDPLLGAGEVLVVAGDEERPVTCRQLGQRGGRGAEVLHAAVDQVADDRDQVGLGRVDRVDDLLREAAPQHRAQVDVADHGDPVSVRGARQLGQRHGDPLDLRSAQDAVGPVPDGPDRGRRGGSADDPGDEQPTGGAGTVRRGALLRRGARLGALRRVLRRAGRLRALHRLRVRARRPARRYQGAGRLRGGRPCPALQHPAQQGADQFAGQQGQQQVQGEGQPQVPRPGQHALEGERSLRAGGDHAADEQQPPSDDHRRADAAHGAGPCRGVPEQSAPHIPVARHQDGDDQQCDEYEDDGHEADFPCFPLRRHEVRDVRLNARRPRNPMPPTTVPSTKETTASVR